MKRRGSEIAGQGEKKQKHEVAGDLFTVDGEKLASIVPGASCVTLPFPFAHEYQAQASPESLVLTSSRAGNNRSEAESKALTPLQHELDQRRKDHLALAQDLKKKQMEIINAEDDGEDDSNDLMGLLGMQRRHRKRIAEIRRMSEISTVYQRWTGQRATLPSGTLVSLAGFPRPLVYCPSGTAFPPTTGTAIPTVLWERIGEKEEFLVFKPSWNDRYLYAYGGCDVERQPRVDFERYSLETEKWELMPPMATGRWGCAAAVLSNKLYALGGNFLNSVERFDVENNIWEEVSPMATDRCLCSAGVLEGRLYAVGGWGSGETLNTMEVYDDQNDTWTAAPPMIERRKGLSVAILDGYMYAIGGHNGPDDLKQVERYDPRTETWEAVAPMITGRACFGVGVLHGLLYVMGGRVHVADGFGGMAKCERYDPKTNTWESVASMPVARCGLSGAVLNGRLYAAGGRDYTNEDVGDLSLVECYSTELNEWRKVGAMENTRISFGLVAM